MSKNFAYFLLLFMSFLSFYSCVDDVSFGEAYEKQLVVMCTLNNLDDVQHLYMHYSKAVEADTYEPLTGNVKAILYQDDDRSNEVVFERISDVEWNVNYHVASEVQDEIWEVPNFFSGMDTVTIRHIYVKNIGYNLEISLDGKVIAHSHATIAQTTFDSMVNYDFHVVNSSENYVFWFVDYNEGVFSEKVTLVDKSPLPSENADAIREDSVKSLDGFNLIGANEYYFGVRFDGKSGGSIVGNKLLIPSVEYDEYLTSLIYRAIHIDPDDPAKQMNDYKVKSNVIGGTGVFGVYYLISSPPRNPYYY